MFGTMCRFKVLMVRQLSAHRIKNCAVGQAEGSSAAALRDAKPHTPHGAKAFARGRWERHRHSRVRECRRAEALLHYVGHDELSGEKWGPGDATAHRQQ